MEIKELSAQNYGRFDSIRLFFRPGMNVICGENGAGKSTVASMVRALFYTFAPSKKSAVAENERKKMTPWGDSGDMLLRGVVADEEKREYIIERSFGKTAAKDRLKVLTPTGEDVTQRFYPEPGETFFGLSEGGFSRTAFFPQQRIALDKNEDLIKKLLNLVSSADETISPADALARLDTYRKSLDNGRGGGKIPELLKEETALREKKERALLLREKNFSNLERLKILEGEIDAAEKTLAENKSELSGAELKKKARLYAKYLSLLLEMEKSDAVLNELKDGITAGDELFDAAQAATLEAMVQEAEAKFVLVRNLEAYAEEQRKELAEKEKELEEYSGLLSGEGCDAMIARVSTARAEAEQKIREIEEIKSAAEEKRARIASIRAVHREFAKLSDEEGKEVLDLYDSAEKGKKSGIFSSFLFLLCAVAAGAGAYFFYALGYDDLLVYAFAGLGALFVAVCIFWIYLRLKKYDLQSEDIEDLLSAYGAQDITDFARLLSESRREKYESELLEKEIKEMDLPAREAELLSAREEIDALDESVKRILRENKMSSVSALLAAGAEAKEKRLFASALKKRLFESEAEQERSAFEAGELAFAALERAKKIRPECETLQNVKTLVADCRESFSKIKAELIRQEMLERQIAEIAAQDLRPLEEAYEILRLRGENLSEGSAVTDKSEALFRRLSDLKSERAAIYSEIREPSLWGDALLELDEAAEAIRKKLGEAKIEHEAVLLAIEKVKEAYSELESNFAPQLIEGFERKMEQITGQKIPAVVGKEFEVRFLRDNALREIGYFSKGITDAAYVALRLALTGLSEGEKRLPLVLDDVFSDLDEKNFLAAAKLLSEEAKERQVIFFTCQKREENFFLALGAHLIRI